MTYAQYLIAKERIADFERTAERRRLLSEIPTNHSDDGRGVVRARFYLLLRRTPSGRRLQTLPGEGSGS